MRNEGGAEGSGDGDGLAEGAEPISPGWVKHHTVSDVIERLGLTWHTWYTIFFVWWIWIFAGWTGTAVVYVLDAAGERGGDWVSLTSPADRLTPDDKTWTLLCIGIFAAAGNSFLGSFSDVKGRVLTIEICILSSVVSIAGWYLASTKAVLILFILLSPFLRDGPALVSQALLAEWLPIEWRGQFLVILHALWNVGRLLVSIVWVFVPPSEQWKSFVMLVVLPPVILSVYIRIRGWRYESPRFHAVTGNMEACVANLKLAAASSPEGHKLPPGWDDSTKLQLEGDSGKAIEADERPWHERVRDLWRPDVRFTALVLGGLFFTNFWLGGFLFFWSIEYFKRTGQTEAVVPCMIGAPVAKAVAAAILVLGGRGNCIIDRCPRIPVWQVGFIGAGVSLLVLTMSKHLMLSIVAYMVGQIFEEFCWTVGGTYVIEVFPTSVRATAQGAVFTMGNIGGILGTAFGEQLMEVWLYLPMIMTAGVLFLAAAAAMLLTQERGHSALSDTLSYGAASDAGSSKSEKAAP